MLRIRALSGEEVASIPVEELTDVRELKLKLHRLHGFPTRFKQRLFLRGDPMDDSAELDSPMDLELVLLTFFDASQAEAAELVTAAANGSASQVPHTARGLV